MAFIIKLKNHWINYKRKKTRENFDAHLKTKEILESEHSLLRLVQKETFPTEYQRLSANQEIKHSSVLPLRPILWKGLLRVGGRIKHAEVPFETKHQIILSHKHPASKLILDNIHQRNMHAGVNHLVCLSRNNYWITHIKTLSKQVVRACQHCRRLNVRPVQPLMGNLPIERLSTKEHAFTFTGVDYFGPIQVKLSKRTRSNVATSKRYGVLFTCLTVRAIHLELAGDLSTDAFIMAFKRFKARRGQPKIIWSDNGTNFVGADKELKDLIIRLDTSKIQNYATDQHIAWKFNPPSSPWMGGSWESLVKLTKRAMNSIMKDRLFTDEVLSTILCEVEFIVNSRPLTPASDDPSDYECLTPQHFLSRRFSVPVDAFYDYPLEVRRKWKSVVAASNMFWNRFRKEYLTSLNIRRKWTKTVGNVRDGDLVILKTDNVPRIHWPLARVTKTFPGTDNIVRAAEIRLPNGTTIIRPTSKLCIFESFGNGSSLGGEDV